MKLKSKIIAAGISTVTILGSSMLLSNNFNIENYSSKKINNEYSTVNEINKEQITTLEELDKYIHNASVGTYLKILNNGFLGNSYTGNNTLLNIHETPTPLNNEIKFVEVPENPGEFYIRIENLQDPEKGFLVQCILPSMGGSGVYANQQNSSYSDKFEVWKYKGEILILPKIFSTTNYYPEEQEIGEYYDIDFKGPSQSQPLGTKSIEFPTDDILDGWNFKVKQDIIQEISNIKPEGINSISLDIKQPSFSFTDLTPTSFKVSIDGQEVATPINMNNPGTKENFIINSELIDHTKSQEITLNFGDFFGNEKFTTSPIASTISVSQYSEKQINVDISNFLNGTGFTEATDFQIIINGIIDEKNKYSISELSEDVTTKMVDISNFISEETIEVKIKYSNSNFESLSPPTEFQLKKNIMGIFSLEDLYKIEDQSTYGKIKVNIFGQDLLPVITHAKITARRIDGVAEEPKVVNVAIPKIPQELITQELNLSHPAEYRIDVQYINEEDPSIELLGSPEPFNGIETIKTRTGVTVTTLADKTNLLEDIDPDGFSITGEFNVGHDEFGVEHPGETFELYLNGALFDSNLLSGDNSNIEYPALSKGTFNKTYENIDLSIYNGLELDVETDLEIMLNGSQVWTSKIKFYQKIFELPTIAIKNLNDTTATVSYEDIIQGNGQQLATQYDFSLFTVSNEGNKILVPEYTENDKLLSESKTHKLINLTPGLTYEANMKFKHDDGTIIANLSTKEFRTKKFVWTMLSLILLSTLIFTGVKFITKRRSKIEFE